MLRSFKPTTHAQGAKGAGIEVRAVGVDPRRKECVRQSANNENSRDRDSLGGRTCLVDGNTGETRYREQESGKIVPSFERAEAFHEEPRREPARDSAEARFKEAELQQVEAEAQTIGIPALRAKQNVEVKGVGRKFSGIYYVVSVRHEIGSSGYGCELKLKRNALGKGAGEKTADAKGKKNTQEAPENHKDAPPAMITIDADTGERK